MGILGRRVSVRHAISSLLVRLLSGTDVMGIRVVSLADADDRSRAIRQIADALTLLSAVSPAAYRRVRKRVRQIVVWPATFSAAVHPATVKLSTAHFNDDDSLELASVLVHEATHLAIGARGIRFSDHQERIERLCIKEQADMLRRAGPAGHLMAEMFEERLQEPWWTDAAHAKDVADSARALKLPRWFTRLIGAQRSSS